MNKYILEYTTFNHHIGVLEIVSYAIVYGGTGSLPVLLLSFEYDCLYRIASRYLFLSALVQGVMIHVRILREST